MKDLTDRVKLVEEQVKGIVKENEKLQEGMEQIAEKNEKLEENIGMIDVYKAIIKNSEDARLIQKETDKFFKIIILILSILIIVLGFTLAFTHLEFTHYRENSISKAELIEYLKN